MTRPDRVRSRRSLPAGCSSALLLALALALLASGGCAGASFKAGASPDQIARDEQECRAASEARAAYEACMKDRGYLTVDGDRVR